MNSRGKETIIKNLALALRESMEHQFIVNKKPPYRVPSHINGDLWQWETTQSKTNAHKILESAINRAAGKE